MLNSGRLGIVQSEVEAVLALLWREQHEKVAKKQQIAEHLRFLDFVFRALSSFETHANAQNIYHHIKCKIMSLFKKNFEKRPP